MKPALLIAVMAVTGVTFAVSATQLEPETRPAGWTDTVDVTVATIEVWVTDRKGNPVKDLTVEDFELFEDGRRVAITNFYAAQGGRPAQRRMDREAHLDTELVPAESKQQLYVSIFVDQVNLQPADRKRVLSQLAELIERGFAVDAQYMVMSHFPSLKILQAFTDDPMSIIEALGKLEEHSAPGVHRASDREHMLQRIEAATNIEGIREQVYQYAERIYNNTGATLDTLGQVISSLGGLEGRKVLLYVGGGLPLIAGEDLFWALTEKFGDSKHMLYRQSFATVPWLEEIVRLANASRVTLYAIDSAGLSAPAAATIAASSPGDRLPTSLVDNVGTGNSQDGLILLARETGGRAMVNSNRLARGFEGMVADLGSYYSLGFEPSNPDAGGYRRLEVRLRSNQWTVRHRAGYSSRSFSDRRVDRTVASLIYGADENSLSITVEPFIESTSSAECRVDLDISIPLSHLEMMPRRDDFETRLGLKLALMDDKNTLSEVQQQSLPVRIPMTRADRARKESVRYRWSFRLPVGRYTYAVGVWNETDSAASVIHGSLEIDCTAARP